MTTTEFQQASGLPVAALGHPQERLPSLILDSALSRQMQRQFDAITEESETPAEWRRNRFRIAQKLMVVSLLADTAVNRQQISWSHQARRISSAAQLLAREIGGDSEQPASDLNSYRQRILEVKRLVDGTSLFVRVATENRELPLLMKQMDASIQSVSMAAENADISGEELDRAIDDAALIALIANRLQTRRPDDEATEWTSIASRLETTAASINNADSFRRVAGQLGASCTACHKSYRN